MDLGFRQVSFQRCIENNEKYNEPKLINRKNYYIKYVWDFHPSNTEHLFSTQSIRETPENG